MNKPKTSSILFGTLLVFLLTACSNHSSDTTTNISQSNVKAPLRMAISPYQDCALIVNAKQLGLEKKYDLNLELVSLPGEELLSSLASAGQTVDVSYALLTDYLMKAENLNREGADPIIFLYPIFVFRGGGFVTFNPDVPEINSKTINDPTIVKKFLSYKIGTPKSTWSEVMLFMLAKKVGLKLSDLHHSDIPLSDGLLAAENGSLDITAAGLPQRNECLRRHGRLVFGIDTLGIGEIIGLACRESIYRSQKKDIESFIKLWVECANKSLSDIDHNCTAELAYLKANASTKYSIDEFKYALGLEYIPKNIAEINKEIVSDAGKYSIKAATKNLNQYLIEIGKIKTARPVPKLITLTDNSN